MDDLYTQLPWNFEAFRKFISFSSIQNAASVICLYDNKDIFSSPQLLNEFEKTMDLRTGLTWSPDRKVSDDIDFNIEGNLFRNKARVLSSLYLLNPITLATGKLEATEFCKALGGGLISEKDFFKEIFCRYTFPHPAYEENWTSWSRMNLRLKPFVFILDILVKLAAISPDQSYLSINEFAYFGHSFPIQNETNKIVQKIIENRKTNLRIERKRSDKVDRKIGDIFGFMCMSQFCYFDKGLIRLNLIKKHRDEQVYFYLSRSGESSLEEIRFFVTNSKI